AGGEIKMCMPPEELFTHAEELEALSLDIPIIAKVRNKLKEKGIDVPYNKDYSVFAKSVAKALKGEGK
ncbi:MAG: energy-coupling factor ABC transporter ATP-binding protein, partial [Clostridia bacterium]